MQLPSGMKHRGAGVALGGVCIRGGVEAGVVGVRAGGGLVKTTSGGSRFPGPPTSPPAHASRLPARRPRSHFAIEPNKPCLKPGWDSASPCEALAWMTIDRLVSL
mgnify:CR=1 FL=1